MNRKQINKEERAINLFQNDQFKSLFNQMEDGFFIADEEGFVLWMNDSSLKQIGAKREDLINKNVKELEESGYFSPSITQKVMNEHKTISQIQKSANRKYLATGKKIKIPYFEKKIILTQIKDITETVRASLNIEEAEYLLKRYWKELQNLKYSKENSSFIIGQSKTHNKIMRLVEQIAPYEVTVLIEGETGVGKNVIAKEIHRLSQRKKEKFVQINCGAIPENLLESELFGYKKGAFTGAAPHDKKGLLSEAQGGTLFLDEISELPMNLQPKILQLTQSKTYIPIGATKEEHANVRIISATNEDLHQKIKQKKFRKDLYYRLNVISILIPPLRERRADIFPLVYHFLNTATLKYGKEVSLSDEVLKTFQEYDWPGNIREVENIIERLVVTNNIKEIIDTQVWNFFEIQEEKKQNKLTDILKHENLIQYLERKEKEIIKKAKYETNSTRKAAEVLGIPQSSYMRRLKKYF